MRIPSGSTDRVVYFVAVDATDLKTPETGLTGFTVYRSRNGSAGGTYTTPTVTEIDATNMPGLYGLLVDEDTSLTAGHDTEEYAVRITQAAMAPVTRTLELYRPKATEGNTIVVDAAGIADADVRHWLGSAPNALASGRVDTSVGAMAADVITASAIAADAIGSSELAASAATEIAAAVWDEARAGHVTAGTFGQGVASVVGSVGSVASGGITSASFAANSVTASALATDAVNEVAGAVWDQSTSAHLVAGTFGRMESDDSVVLTDTNLIVDTRLPAVLSGGRMDSVTNAMAASVITAATIATDAIDADALAASAVTEIQAGLATSAEISTVLVDTGQISASQPTDLLAVGTADSGTTTTLVDAARTESAADHWKGARLVFVSGALAGQTRLITGFNAGTDTLTFTPATTSAVSAGMDYEIRPDARSDVGLWAGSVPNPLQSGRVDAYLGALAGSVIDAASIAGAAANKIADHVLRRPYGSARTSSDGDALSFRSLLGAMGKLVNRWSISSTTLTVYQEDDATATAPGGTQTVTPTVGANPITQIDTD